jgi:putative phosphoribosyl transferase
MIRDRTQAGQLLCEKLKSYKDTNAVVVAVPHGGVPVAYPIAQLLNLPLNVIPCKKIRHPANKTKSIGSVSLDEAIVHEQGHDIPQDYIARQIQDQFRLLKEQKEEFSKNLSTHTKGKIVILVDDRLKTGDTLLASIRSLRKQRPEKIVVAVPVVTLEGVQHIQQEVDDIVYLEMSPDVTSVIKYFEDLPIVEPDETIELLKKSGTAHPADASV